MLTLKEVARPGVYSQFGEDTMIETLLDEMEWRLASRLCVDIGANDGVHLSNTAMFWKDLGFAGWTAILVEANEEHRSALEASGQTVHIVTVTPENINLFVPDHVFLLSIDIDGDDYYIWEAVTATPEIVVIEFNPSIPYWLDIIGDLGAGYGASPAALIRLGNEKGYFLVGATHCNLLFVRDKKIADRFETRPEKIIGTNSLTYLTTDYVGRPYVFGALPFGLNTEDGWRELA